MALNFAEAKKSKKDFGRVEDGAYPARVVQIIDFGRQVETDYKTGEVKKYDDGNDIVKHKVWINFEFPTETIEIDGETKPRWYGKEFTISSHEKSAMFNLLKAIDPKGTATNKGRNVKGMLGLPAMVTIGSTSGGKAKIVSVSGVPKGMQVDALANPEVLFDLDGDDLDTFNALPKWMQDRITDGVDFDTTRFYQVVNSKDHKTNPAVGVEDY